MNNGRRVIKVKLEEEFPGQSIRQQIGVDGCLVGLSSSERRARESALMLPWEGTPASNTFLVSLCKTFTF